MLKESLPLYHSHFVKAYLENGESVEGTLMIAAQGSLEIGEANYQQEQLTDVLYIGEMTDYHTFQRSGVIDGAYRFAHEDCVNPQEFDSMKYHEQECRVSCHLEIRENAICATEVQIVSSTHVLNQNVLCRDKFLYTLEDGRKITGVLEMNGESFFVVQDNGVKEEICPESVEDITRAPVINDVVTVVLKDGSSISGLVSAVQADYLLVIENMLPKMVFFTELCQLRYHGVVTNNGAVDSLYQYKVPFLRDSNQEKDLQAGAGVSYVAGVNSRYRIAKDIIVEEAVQKEEASNELEHYGVILMLDIVKPDGVGYIGAEYRSKVCGDQPRGTVRFKKSQLSFPYEFDKIFVVKYSIQQPESSHSPAILGQMELVKALDFSQTGIVRVDEQGNVEAVPLYRAVPTYYEGKDVDVVTKDGVYSGIFSLDEDGICIKGENIGLSLNADSVADGSDRMMIPFEAVERVRIKGKVTRYNANGTGYIDNIYFFHINDISNASVATKIQEGVLLSFELKNTRKGAGYYCTQIDVIGEVLEGYAIDWKDGVLTVADEKEYEENPESASLYAVELASCEEFPELEQYAYRASFTLQMSGNRKECTSVHVRERVGRTKNGYITSLEDGIVQLATDLEYGAKEPGNSYLLLNEQQVKTRLNNINCYDYSVKYRIQNRNSVQIIFVGEALEKEFTGYIDTYYNDRQFGYITPEIYYGKKNFVERMKEGIDVWCRPNTFKNAPGPLDTSCYTYRVRYTLDYTTQAEKAPALQVTFLETIEKSQKQTTPTPVPVKEVVLSFREEVSDPAEVYGTEDESGNRYAYGVLAAYSVSFDAFKITETYQNKKYYNDGFVFDDRGEIAVEAEKAEIRSEEKINTAKYVYLVRFVPGEPDEAGEPKGINYAFPVEIADRFNKKAVRKLEMEGGKLHLELVEKETKTVLSAKEEAEPVKNREKKVSGTEQEQVTVRPMEQEETFFYKTPDGSMNRGDLESADGERLYLADGRVLELPESSIYRLGVLTGFDEEFRTGYLNRGLNFSLSVMENKTYNIVKTAKKSMLLAYQTQDGCVCRVQQLTKEMTAQLYWTEGMAGEYVDNDAYRMLRIDKDVVHYLSVLTDGLVSRMAKNGTLNGLAVYVKKVNCPVWAEETEIITVAAEVHCAQEPAKEIRYDAAQDRYLAYRDQTHLVTVHGKAEELKASMEEKAPVIYFEPDASGCQLEAWISRERGNDFDSVTAESKEDQNTILAETPLGSYCLNRVDLRQRVLTGKIELDEEGWPATNEQAVKLVENLCKGYPAVTADNMFTIAAVVKRLDRPGRDRAFQVIFRSLGKTRRLSGLMRKAFRRRAEEIIHDNNGNLGECAYYLTTLLKACEADTLETNLYNLFLQDFKSPLEAREAWGKGTLRDLFSNEPEPRKLRQVIAHILPLDKTSGEQIYTLFRDKVIAKNSALTQEIFRLCEEMYDTVSAMDPAECLEMLAHTYMNYKEYYGERLRGAEWYQTLNEMRDKFLILMSAEDRQRFESFAECSAALFLQSGTDYRSREIVLDRAYREITGLVRGVEQHPTELAWELLAATGLLNRVCEEVGNALNQLYQDKNFLPKITCNQNSSEVLRDREDGSNTISVRFFVENGAGTEWERQSARNAVFSFQMLTEGIQITPEMKLPRELKSGEMNRQELEIPVEIGDFNGDSFSVQWSVSYEYVSGVDENRAPIYHRLEEDGPVMNFHLYRAKEVKENRLGYNPYKEPAEAMEGLDLHKDNMFFGRKDKLDEIWTRIVDEEGLVKGSIVIVHGQKRCGKTILIDKVKRDILEKEELREKTIILHIKNMSAVCSDEELPYFYRLFYHRILKELKMALMTKHPGILKKMSANQLEFPDLKAKKDGKYVEEIPSVAMREFFEKFYEIEGNNCKILLIMDEFTGLCRQVMRNCDKDASIEDIPKFLEFLQELEFVQIVIGHAAMMRLFGKLDMLNDLKLARDIRVSAFDPKDSRKLIKEPMERCFGYDVYGTISGRDAVEKLLELSGGSPYWLMKLCNEMFEWFMTKTRENYLEVSDVDAMVEEYVQQLDADDFEMLLTEKADNVTTDFKRPAHIYLEHISRISYDVNTHDCPADTVCQELVTEELPPEQKEEQARKRSYEQKELLKERDVIKEDETNGRIRLITWLFAEFCKRKK